MEKKKGMKARKKKTGILEDPKFVQAHIKQFNQDSF
jgi:hypothetical protein